MKTAVISVHQAVGLLALWRNLALAGVVTEAVKCHVIITTGEKNNVRLQMVRTTIYQQMRLLDGSFHAILHRSKSICALLEVMKGNIAVKITPPLVLAGHSYKTMCLKAACADTLPIWNLSCYKGAAATLGNLFRSSEWLGSALMVVEDGVDLLHDGSYLWSELRNGRQDSDMVRIRIRRTASRGILSWL